eukprot:CAMPEP_0168530478 /NCGR_PEP_ID=MMETSP0405-20121227/14701_1 /TAXON_ID=498012 /ORGANISM="Trichosphaerium sp, Strain Am-I-7 wt" /LENGTH=190 /DNA_ID=CAMNT_0008554747 /DNA_START=62 /DNA_END=634 /DNA_ORIENTATION=+
MVGKDCVAIGSDTRYGISAQTLAMDMPKVYKITESAYVGLPGLISDAQTMFQKIKFKVNMYNLREERVMSAKVLSQMISSMLYEKRFGPYFVEPIIAGVDNGKPFLCAMDLIGALEKPDDFVCAGTAAEAMFGMAESLWKPGLEADDLFEVVAQTLLSAVDRDAISGWGGVVHVITKDAVTTRTLKGRQD